MSTETRDLERRGWVCVRHRQTTHAITRNERSHVTDNHANNMYITHIYTQARQEYDNRDEYLARIACSMIIKIIYNQENQSCQIK